MPPSGSYPFSITSQAVGIGAFLKENEYHTVGCCESGSENTGYSYAIEKSNKEGNFPETHEASSQLLQEP